jgi:hypothetical protein
VRVLFVPGGDLKLHDGILFAPPPAELPQFRDRRGTAIADTREALKKFKLFPDEVFGLTGVEGNEAVRFQNESAHILARELNAGAIEESLERGRAYAAYDWLCDPAGFYFIAQNNLGVFDMGDSAPMLKGTRLVVNLPVPAKVKIMHDGAAVAESDGVSFSYQVKAEGSYWLDAALPLAGEDRSWIHTNPIHVAKPPALSLPAGEVAPEVEVRKDIEYVDDGIAKHKLDVYLPKGKKNFPVMVFYHAVRGDRATARCTRCSEAASPRPASAWSCPVTG